MVATILQIADVALRTTSALIEYTRNTKNASADRRLLAEEAQSLSAVLERLRARAETSNIEDKWLEQRTDLVKQFARAYDDLATTLKINFNTKQPEQESRVKTIQAIARWSFTKSEIYSVLERITRLQLYSNTLLLDEQYSLVERIESRQGIAQEKKQRSMILGWLTPLQVTTAHESISKRPEQGSGRWFLTSSIFRSWQSGAYKLLWCPGIRKSLLDIVAFHQQSNSNVQPVRERLLWRIFHRLLWWPLKFADNCRSIVVEHIRHQRTKKEVLNKEVGVAMMYLKYTDHQQTLENILGSFLVQLAQDHEPLPLFLRDLYERHRAYGTSPTLSDLSIALSDISNLYQRIYVILDALDECTDDVRWELMEKLREIEPEVHLLVTSRDLDSIEEELHEFQRLEIKANKADMELFIDHHIQKNKNLRRIVQKSPTMSDDIKVAVVTTAEDMYSSLQLSKTPGHF